MNERQPDFEAELYFLRTEEGGRKKPVFSGYRAQLFYAGHDWDAEHFYPHVKEANPGDHVIAQLTTMSPDCHLNQVYPGMEFTIKEGQRVVATGKITRILNLEKNAARILAQRMKT